MKTIEQRRKYKPRIPELIYKLLQLTQLVRKTGMALSLRERGAAQLVLRELSYLQYQHIQGVILDMMDGKDSGVEVRWRTDVVGLE
jgi:hypothetical protein